MKASIVAIGVVYTAAAIVSLTGFAGALMKKLGAIKTYLFFIYGTLVFQIAVAIFTLISYYRYRGTSAMDCTSEDANPGTISICEEYARIPQGWIIASAIVPIVIQAYACYIVSAYKNKLIQQMVNHSSRAMKSNPVYTSVAPLEETYPLSQPTVVYPYADGPNAYGAKGHSHDGSNNV